MRVKLKILQYFYQHFGFTQFHTVLKYFIVITDRPSRLSENPFINYTGSGRGGYPNRRTVKLSFVAC